MWLKVSGPKQWSSDWLSEWSNNIDDLWVLSCYRNNEHIQGCNSGNYNLRYCNNGNCNHAYLSPSGKLKKYGNHYVTDKNGVFKETSSKAVMDTACARMGLILFLADENFSFTRAQRPYVTM